MSKQIEQIDAALENPYVRAWLDTIASAEVGEAGDNGGGYNVTFGGDNFTDYSKHPGTYGAYRDQRGKLRKSSAAGRYQILLPTWQDLQKRFPNVFTDFSPKNQDRALIRLAQDVGALDDMLSGNFDAAESKLAKRWASLSSSKLAEGIHGTRSAEFVRNAYNNALSRQKNSDTLHRAKLPEGAALPPQVTSAPSGTLSLPSHIDWTGNTTRQMLQQRYARRRIGAVAAGPLTQETGVALMNTLFNPSTATPVHPSPTLHNGQPTLVQHLTHSSGQPATAASVPDMSGPLDKPDFNLAPPQPVSDAGIQSRDLPPQALQMALEEGMATLLADPRGQVVEAAAVQTPEAYLAEQLVAAGAVNRPDDDFLKVAALEMPYRDALLQLIDKTPVHDFLG